jgi:hypothetical protein
MSSSGVSTSVTGTDTPSTVTLGVTFTSFLTAYFRNSSSVVPGGFGGSSFGIVLHSTEDAATNIWVPDLTVHDSTPAGAGPNGASVPPRSQHPNLAPPVPKEFWALGV